MPKQVLTKEFGICLLPDTVTTQRVLGLRKKLPASPYRDDRPHITLLRGITSPQQFSDVELFHNIKRILNLSNSLPLIATAQDVVNISNQFYSASCVILLQSSKLLNIRRVAAKKLNQNGYSIEKQELKTYTPHITIRLGVPLAGEILTTAQATFIGNDIIFSKWILFRLIIKDDARKAHEIDL